MKMSISYPWYQFATVAVIGWLLTLVFPQPPSRIGTSPAAALAYCALFPTVICFTLQNTWQRHTTPTQAGLIYTLDPVWSMLGGFLVLGERLSPGEWLGCLLILQCRRCCPWHPLLSGKETQASHGSEAPATKKGLRITP